MSQPEQPKHLVRAHHMVDAFERREPPLAPKMHRVPAVADQVQLTTAVEKAVQEIRFGGSQ